MSNNISNNINNNSEELWCAFGEEVGEQLDKLDIELTKGTASCDIHQVFRYFHTIKSSCAMLDMGSMKELAHLSEDYLDLVRRGSLPLTEAAIDVLLLAVETLKRQLMRVMETRQNPEPAVDIITAIRQLLQAPVNSSQNQENTAAAGCSPHITTAANQEIRQNLELLAESSRKVLLELAQARQLTTLLKNNVIHFGNMAQLLDFPLLQVLCRDVVLSFPAKPAAVLPVILLRHEADLLDRIGHLEQEYGVDCGSEAATHQFRLSLEKEFMESVLFLADIFSGLDHKDLAAWLEEQHGAAEKTLEKMVLFASLFGLPELRNLFSYTIQVIRSARRGYFQPAAELPSVLQEVINHSYIDLLREGEQVWGKNLVACREKLQQLTQRVALAAGPSTSDPVEKSSVEKSPVAKISCDIDIDMGSESTVVEQLVEWISLHGSRLHSTASVTGKANCITFRAEFGMTTEQVGAELSRIDPDKHYFHLTENHETSVLMAAVDTAVSQEVVNAVVNMSPLLGSTLRIGSQAIDKLVTQVGEVVMARNMIGTLVNREQYDIVLRKCRYFLEQHESGEATAQQTEELKNGLLELIRIHEELMAYDTHLHAAITQVQEKVLNLREMPVSMVLNRLPNIVRKVSHGAGKSIQLQVSGQDACIDKGMMDILFKTLARLLQHLIEHGAGIREISVQARVRGNYLEISLGCDSRIPDRRVLTEVKRWLDPIGGVLRMEDGPEHQQASGTVVSLDLPRTVAMQNLLLVRSGHSVAALAERNIVEVRRLKNVSIQALQGRASMTWRDQVIPLVSLGEWVQGAGHVSSRFEGGAGSLVIVSYGAQHTGILVDEIVGLRDSFVPEIHVAFSGIPHISGTTILGDGSVVFVLNVESLMGALYRKLPKLFHRVVEQERAA